MSALSCPCRGFEDNGWSKAYCSPRRGSSHAVGLRFPYGLRLRDSNAPDILCPRIVSACSRLRDRLFLSHDELFRGSGNYLSRPADGRPQRALKLWPQGKRDSDRAVGYPVAIGLVHRLCISEPAAELASLSFGTAGLSPSLGKDAAEAGRNVGSDG
jgi:hypothetical protein